MNFVIGDTITPLPELFTVSDPARRYLELHRVYTIKETGRSDITNRHWFKVERCHVSWIDSPEWWKLAIKSTGFILDEIT